MYGHMFSQELQKQAVLVGPLVGGVPRTLLPGLTKTNAYMNTVGAINKLKQQYALSGRSATFSVPKRMPDPAMDAFVRGMLKHHKGYLKGGNRYLRSFVAPLPRSKPYSEYLNSFSGQDGIRGSIIP